VQGVEFLLGKRFTFVILHETTIVRRARDFLVKAPTLKELLCRGGFRHRWPLTPQSQLFKFAPEPFRSPATIPL
jgi:hypothetical protein